VKRSLAASVALLGVFIVAALVRGNHEFLFYASTLMVVLGVLFLLDRHYDFSALSLWGFDAWLLLHLLGGMGTVGGTRLYDYMLLPVVGEPYEILKYDQLVHVFCYAVMAMLVWEVIARLTGAGHTLATILLTVLAASGIGGLNEIVEFAAVVLVGSTGVGGYSNTALDLVANLLGAGIGAGYKAIAAGKA
jgi:uncharacterized membrane protein YjdF